MAYAYQNYGGFYPQYGAGYTQPQMQQPQQPQQPQQSSLIWVQGEAGAKSYLVAPNTTVALWDSEAQTIYLKSSDGAGMPSMKILDYSIRESNKSPSQALQTPQNAEYVTHEELDKFKNEISEKIKEVTSA